MRLNLGAGGQRLEGWTSLDRAGDVDVIAELTDPLPFEGGSCEAVLAHHVLCMIPPEALPNLLSEIRRVLQPDGWLRISDADLLLGINAGLAGDKDWFPEQRGDLNETLGWFITQGGARKTFVTRNLLARLLREAGFYRWNSDEVVPLGPDWLYELDSREGESFFAVAQ